MRTASLLLLVAAALLVATCTAQGNSGNTPNNANQRRRIVTQRGNSPLRPEDFPLECNPAFPCPVGFVCVHFTQSRGEPFKCVREDLVDDDGIVLAPLICPLVCPCRHGFCSSLAVNDFRCVCFEGFHGKFCDEPDIEREKALLIVDEDDECVEILNDLPGEPIDFMDEFNCGFLDLGNTDDLTDADCDTIEVQVVEGDCDPDPCNGGVCFEFDDESQISDCTPLNGDNAVLILEEKVDEPSHVCLFCPNGRQGPNCEFDACEFQNCGPFARCEILEFDNTTIGVCICDQFFFGPRCEFCICEPFCFDNTDPILVVPPAVTVECGDSLFPDCDGTGAPLAADICGLERLTFTNGPLNQNPNCPGTGSFVRTFVAEDVCGNDVNATQVITIVDTTPPTVIAELTPIGGGLRRQQQQQQQRNLHTDLFGGAGRGPAFATPLQRGPLFGTAEVGSYAGVGEQQFVIQGNNGHSDEFGSNGFASVTSQSHLNVFQCLPPSDRQFLINCTIFDDCQSEITVNSKLLVTHFSGVRRQQSSGGGGLFGGAGGLGGAHPLGGGLGGGLFGSHLGGGLPQQQPLVQASVRTDEMRVQCGDTLTVVLESEFEFLKRQQAADSKNAGLVPFWFDETGTSETTTLTAVTAIRRNMSVRALQVRLVVSAVDACGNRAVSIFDPAFDADPVCSQRLSTGDCCPSIRAPPEPVQVKEPSLFGI